MAGPIHGTSGYGDEFSGPGPSNGYKDVDALRETSTNIVIGVGEPSTSEQLPFRTAHALAGQLGVEPVQFPGDHAGFGSHAGTFAIALKEALADDQEDANG